MSKILQHRRGRTSDLTSILGAVGEIFVDTSLVTIVVHDGVTTGGVTLARASVSGITIGTGAGQTNQQKPAIAIGINAGNDSQGVNAIAMGASAGFISQSSYTIAIGASAGNTYQRDQAIALGNTAGQSNQGDSAIAMGVSAGNNNQSSDAISIGSGAGQNYQKTGAIAIGANAGATGVINSGQGIYAIAVGYQAGTTDQADYSIALGYQAGNNTQRTNSIAIGNAAATTGQGTYAIAIGAAAGRTDQQTEATAMGYQAGNNTQGQGAVALGSNAGTLFQGNFGVAVGFNTGYNNQGGYSVAVGIGAANQNQGTFSVAVGSDAGAWYQASNAIAMGYRAATTGQGSYTVAIGDYSGAINQGTNSIAIGRWAAPNNQCSNTIILNASGTTSQTVTSNALYINPIRSQDATTAALLSYNSITKEVIADYNPITSGITLTASGAGILEMPGAPQLTNGSVGMIQVGAPLAFNDVNILMSLTQNVNNYTQLILQNLNSSSAASADLIVNNNRTGGTTIYGDFGINSQNYSGTGAFVDPDGTYLYAAGGTLTIGTNGATSFKIATNDTARLTMDSAGATTWTSNVTLVGTLSATTVNAGALNLPVTSNARVRTINYVLDGGGAAITTGGKGVVRVDFDCTITSWTILADASGSIVVDVYRGTYAQYGAAGLSSGLTIAGTQKPTLTTSSKTTNITLTSWTTSLSAGDILEFNVDSASTVQQVTVSLKVIANN